MKRIPMVLIIVSIFLAAASSLWAEQKIEPFPETPYDRFVIYETLVCFWVGIIGLVVIIRMKLREIERSRKMGLDGKEKDIPFLSSDDGRAAP